VIAQTRADEPGTLVIAQTTADESGTLVIAQTRTDEPGTLVIAQTRTDEPGTLVIAQTRNDQAHGVIAKTRADEPHFMSSPAPHSGNSAVITALLNSLRPCVFLHTRFSLLQVFLSAFMFSNTSMFCSFLRL